jgi:hypothetical protein
LKLAEGGGLKLAQDAEKLINGGVPDFSALIALAERVTKVKDGLAEFGDHLSDTLARRVRESSFGPEDDYRGWIEAWDEINHIFARAKGIHMEPRQTIIQAARLIDSGRRHSSSL